MSNEPTLSTDNINDIKTKLLDYDRLFGMLGNKAARFCKLLSEHLTKTELTPDGLIWACEGVLLNEDNDYDRFERKNIRDVLPQIFEHVCPYSNSPDSFVVVTLTELKRIKKTTMNLD